MNVILYNKKERVEHRSNINTLVYYPYCKLLGEIKRDYSTIYNLVIRFGVSNNDHPSSYQHNDPIQSDSCHRDGS